MPARSSRAGERAGCNHEYLGRSPGLGCRGFTRDWRRHVARAARLCRRRRRQERAGSFLGKEAVKLCVLMHFCPVNRRTVTPVTTS